MALINAFAEITNVNNGVNGAAGVTAPRIFTRTVYATGTTQPTDVTGAYNWTTEVLSGLDDWSLTAPTVLVSGSTTYWEGTVVAIENITNNVRQNTGVATVVNISSSFNFDGVVTFTNSGNTITDGTNTLEPVTEDSLGPMGTTTIDGGRITTGTIVTDRLVLGGSLVEAADVDCLLMETLLDKLTEKVDT